ncbi:MAG: hypothetical protein PHS15_07915 [Clostridiaceae bacterium]|nr:hypothetical protein [Clostridiaceae bacterium]
MKILRKSGIVLILLVILVLHTNVYAADALYRFMHNDHDALVIGEIISADENDIKVRVEKGIISGKDLNVSSAKKQLKLVEAKIVSSFSYNFFYNEYGNSIINPSVGDYVLLSLEKYETGFKIAWGAYKVDSLDYKNLSVVLPEDPNVWAKMEAAAIKAFVNSDGKVNEFSFDGEKTVRAGEEQTVIFDGNGEDAAEIIPEDITNILGDINTTEASASMGIIGGADGPTSIYISGSPFNALIIPIIVSAILIFIVGLAVGYFVKAKSCK